MAKRRAIAIIDFLLDISRPPFSLFYKINAKDLHFIAQISKKDLLVCLFVLDAQTVAVLFLSSVVVSETKKYKNNLDVKDEREIPLVKL